MEIGTARLPAKSVHISRPETLHLPRRQA